MLISIILLNYKTPQLTISCVNSLYGIYKDELEKGNIEVIIVDNNSEDDSVTILQKEIEGRGYKHIRVIANHKNDGFGKGCNLGAREARGEYLLFLNNDTVVKDKGILLMADYLDENGTASILGGQLRNADGTLQPSSGSFYTIGKVMLLLLGLQRYGIVDKSPSAVVQVDWVKGGLLMIRRNIFEKLGGFDEKIFMYIEDMELCYRARKAGYLTYFFPKIHILHAEHGSANKSFAIIHIYKNLLYFYKKHRSWGEYILVKSMLILKALLLMCIGFIMKKSYLYDTYSKALKGIL